MVEPDQSLPAENHPRNRERAWPAAAWTQLLERTIQAEILPALLAAPLGATAAGQHDIEAFVAVILADDQRRCAPPYSGCWPGQAAAKPSSPNCLPRPPGISACSGSAIYVISWM